MGGYSKPVEPKEKAQAAAALLPEELELFMGEYSEAAYRARQLFEGIHRQGLRQLDDLTVWPKSLRQKMAGEIAIPWPEVLKLHEDEDGTRRWLLKGEGPDPYEMVHIPLEKRNTLCISSQAGCAVGCVFCATGTLGFRRQLSAFELLAQVYMAEEKVGPLDHLVLMGMGEPLLNLAAVLQFVRVICHPKGRGMSATRITLSTVGFKPGLEELLKFPHPIRLALSLHAASDDLRKQLVPRGGTDISTLLSLGQAYAEKIRQPTTLEWTMMAGVNDGEEQAKLLARLVAKRPFKVNLIPVNPVPELEKTQAPDEEVVLRFMEVLRRKEIDVFRRDTRGGGINAACGQLAARG